MMVVWLLILGRTMQLAGGYSRTGVLPGRTITCLLVTAENAWGGLVNPDGAMLNA